MLVIYIRIYSRPPNTALSLTASASALALPPIRRWFFLGYIIWLPLPPFFNTAVFQYRCFPIPPFSNTAVCNSAVFASPESGGIGGFWEGRYWGDRLYLLSINRVKSKRQDFHYSFEASRSWKNSLLTIYSIGSKLFVKVIVAGLFSSVQDDWNRTVWRRK